MMYFIHIEQGVCSCSTLTNGEFGQCRKIYKKGPICYVNEPSNCGDLERSLTLNKYYSWEACNNTKGKHFVLTRNLTRKII